jgi:hypothetical protein
MTVRVNKPHKSEYMECRNCYGGGRTRGKPIGVRKIPWSGQHVWGVREEYVYESHRCFMCLGCGRITFHQSRTVDGAEFIEFYENSRKEFFTWVYNENQDFYKRIDLSY